MHNTAIQTQTYNGWSNHETWLANLWLTNDESSYGLLMDAIRLHCPATDKAYWLKEVLERQLDDEIETPCLWQDLLRNAFGRIDWVEVIRANVE